MPAELSARLQSYLARALPDRPGPEIAAFAHLSAGWESDIYAFGLIHGPSHARQREELALRLYSGSGGPAKAEHEFAALRGLHRAGYPVPQVLLAERDPSALGQPFLIMERVAGESLWPRLFRAPEPQALAMLTLFCQLLVRLHALDGRALQPPVAPHEPLACIQAELRRYRDILRHWPQPGFEAVLAWLEARHTTVPCPRPAPVHWDFHPANILVRPDGTATVLDWTQFAISDPRCDLAWTLALIGSFEGAAWRERVLAEYERQAGQRVEQLAYFDVLACWKRLAEIVASLRLGPEKLGLRPGAAQVMRQQMRATQVLYDLLRARTGLRLAEVEDVLAAA